MACPDCGCKETYQYDDSEQAFEDGYDDLQRCAACGSIFGLEDETPEDDEAEGMMDNLQKNHGNAAGEAEPVFLLDGARFKLSFNDLECDECGHPVGRECAPLNQYARELQGQWVALVPAENDRHLKLDRLWQPIETAPKDGTLILAFLEDSDACYVIGWCDKAKDIRSYFNADGWCIAWDGESLSSWSQPTHWMPLPPAPTQNAELTGAQQRERNAG